MELIPENAQNQDAIYEGVLTSDDEGNYWISQGQRSAQLDTRGLDENVLEESDGEVISVVGILSMEQKGDSAILDYEISPRIIAAFEGFNPENNSYVSRIGDELLEAYADAVTEYQGDLKDLEEVDEVTF